MYLHYKGKFLGNKPVLRANSLGTIFDYSIKGEDIPSLYPILYMQHKLLIYTYNKSMTGYRGIPLDNSADKKTYGMSFMQYKIASITWVLLS